MKGYSKPYTLKAEDFATEIDAKPVALYTLRNDSGMEVFITNYGAKIVSLIVPDVDGAPVDVVLGHPTIADYLTSEEPYFGAVCGRTANRIAAGKFSIDGQEYQLAINNGPNSLHGGLKGFNAVVWDVIESSDSHLKLHYLSRDGEEGFPGNLSVTVIYSITSANALDIEYEATTDRTTILNLTNHSYFNLSGEGDPYIGDHLLTLNADTYLPTDETAIPYGAAERVEDTPMDFTTPHTIGERIDDDFEALHFGKGYDHTYVLNKETPGEYSYVGVCESPKTGIRMEMYTTEPGVQMYTGNWMTGSFEAKGGHRYPERAAVCFELQHFPDSINKPEYPTVVLRPGGTYSARSTYKFDTIE